MTNARCYKKAHVDKSPIPSDRSPVDFNVAKYERPQLLISQPCREGTSLLGNGISRTALQSEGSLTRRRQTGGKNVLVVRIVVRTRKLTRPSLSWGGHFLRWCWVILLPNLGKGKRASGSPGELEMQLRLLFTCLLHISLSTASSSYSSPFPAGFLHVVPRWLQTAHQLSC